MASTIFQDWLDRIGDSFFSDDFETYADGVDLPLSYVTQTRNIMIDDRIKLRAAYDAWAQMLAGQKATQMIRTARGVFYLTDDLISGSYETEILRNAERITQPFKSVTVLRRNGQTWRAVFVASGLAHAAWPVALPRDEPR